ncbi:hypothetical protein V2L09_02670 [Pseudomonas alliivorans]|nr:hypothetical protein [Pseudomonas alliivorans]
MSKHPIPVWLRSQFSRIEDEVQKLGPCGVFTQMRTVTQTYFEQQAEAAQPLACCTPTAEENALLAAGDYRPEELWGVGGKPSCPKCYAAPQPPALGDEVEIGIGSDEVIEELKMMADMADNNEDPDDHMMYMRWLAAIRSANAQVAPLQAEIEQLKSEIAAYKASRERLHGWIREEQLKNVHLKARCDDLESVMRDIRGANAAYALTKIDAALSKPAGSEKV